MADAPGFVSYSVDNDRRFRDTLRRAAEQVGDLRLPLSLIAKDFYKSQTMFRLKGRGQYEDLAESTKDQKRRLGISVYPILKRTGTLEEAAATPTGRGAINRIIRKDTLEIGVSESTVPYAEFHQDGRGVPMRKFLFIGPEAPAFASSDQSGRPNRWINILNAYVLEKAAAVGRVA
jgi:hypothetical protein